MILDRFDSFGTAEIFRCRQFKKKLKIVHNCYHHRRRPGHPHPRRPCRRPHCPCHCPRPPYRRPRPRRPRHPHRCRPRLVLIVLVRPHRGPHRRPRHPHRRRPRLHRPRHPRHHLLNVYFSQD